MQLHPGFTLEAARELVPYLAALGVTDCYCSPVFRAAPGSTHGYDVSRHTEINHELGGEPAFSALAETLVRRGMGLMLDFVPNHMAVDPETNDWWRDVLENGPSSPFAPYFDIDWDPIKPELKDRLLLPILGDQYGETLERGLLSLAFDRGALVLHYRDYRIPLNPRKAPLVLAHGIDALETGLGPESPALREFLSILTALRNLPPYTHRDAADILERHREKQVARERLDRLADSEPAIRTHIDRAVAAINGRVGDPASFDRLHDLLEQQPYRLASWRTAADEINYRRFFDINQLAGLRVEDPRVFDAIHPLVLQFIAAQQINGLRLDHIDGLYDPAAYLQRLHAATAAAARTAGTSPTTIVVEKILSSQERLPGNWPVAGTTGYTFLNDVNGVFIDGRHARQMLRVYARFIGRTETFADITYECKRLIVSTALSSEFHVLVQAINRVSEADRRSRDFTSGSIGRALREVVACFPVYRTYVTRTGATEHDANTVATAIADARRRNPAMESSIFDFLQSVLIPPAGTGAGADASGEARADIAMRFQQYTAPVQAKGLEDTAFYRYHPLVSLNEVGGDPRRFGRTAVELHQANRERLRRWRGEMLATATHDTKRGEDARTRVNVLSELPGAWEAAALRWRRVNQGNRTRLPSGYAPDANDEYLFYQALVGAWPAARNAADPLPEDFVERMAAFLHKSIKEAKTHTSWITPNDDYESAVRRFVQRSLSGPGADAFIREVDDFVALIAPSAMVASLSQLVLKIASPGVADFYQGTELWDHSLVDPDNRRPVDFARRREWLAELDPLVAGAAVSEAPPTSRCDYADRIESLVRAWPDGRIKLFVTAVGMRARRAAPAVFLDGAYLPLAAEGPAAHHVIAFVRSYHDTVVAAVVPRLALTLSPRQPPLGETAWRGTALPLPPSIAMLAFRDLLTGRSLTAERDHAGRATLQVSDIFSACPVALLWASKTRRR